MFAKFLSFSRGRISFRTLICSGQTQFGGPTSRTKVSVRLRRKGFHSTAILSLSAMDQTNGEEAKRGLAPWAQPSQGDTPAKGLKLHNSLTRDKELFVPQEDKVVNWYICGPTVYDASHMGHARTYVTFDILRRVMQSYFGYNIRYVMNVTDIDDKIIKRARQHHLVEEYLSQAISVRDAVQNVKEALVPFEAKMKVEGNADKKLMLHSMVEKVDSAVANLEKILSKPDAGDSSALDQAKDLLLKEARDILSDWLDGLKGAAISDLDIFMKLAKKFENEYHEDMDRLGVLPANVMTRVSEYVPEIIEFIKKVIENGFAYESNGSVYFNTVAFDHDKSHHYAKLVPEAFGDQDALLEGEGVLSASEDRMKEKKNDTDFALWKTSKGGEPFWESPWGKGRPGWHIECSVMASSICGTNLDIHSGGFDLKFPHHDNEIAQSEAYFGHDQWAHYWLHAGTLRIAGLKMSKSLKNFVTIRQALQEYSSRQIRILFLHYRWNDVLDYSPKSMDQAINFEKIFNEFFLSVKHYLRVQSKLSPDAMFQKFHQPELNLSNQLNSTKAEVHAALCDSIDTRAVVLAMRELLSTTNIYIKEKESTGAIPNTILLKNIAEYFTSLLKAFGVVNENTDIGFGDSSADGQGSKAEEEKVLKFIGVAVDFREKVRQLALKDPKANKEILTVCDELRNTTLPEMGVRLEDKQGVTMIKLVDPEELRKEQEQKKAHEEKKRLEKEAKAKLQAEKEAKARIPPNELFRSETDKYSKFDDKGIPTHDTAGEEISKKQRKKLEKIYEAHEKRFQSLTENGN